MIKVQLNENDSVAANWLHGLWTRNDWLTYGLSYALLIAAGALLMMAEDPSPPIFGAGAVLVYVPVVLWLFTAVGRFALVPRRARKLFHQNKSLLAPYDVTWDEEQMTVTSANWMQRQPWAEFYKWREDDKLFLIYMSAIQFRIIPKRAFPDAATLDAFARLVHDKVPKHKSHRF